MQASYYKNTALKINAGSGNMLYNAEDQPVSKSNKWLMIVWASGTMSAA